MFDYSYTYMLSAVHDGEIGWYRSALLHAGYRVSLSHAHKSSIKTDASARVIWVRLDIRLQ